MPLCCFINRLLINQPQIAPILLIYLLLCVGLSLFYSYPALAQIPVPDAINMFSDVSHYPRGRIVMHPSQPIPQQATIDYNGIMTQHLHTTQHQHAAAEPTGKDFLLKHFYRPRMPYHPGQNNTTRVRLAKVEVKQSAIYESAGSRTVGTQSDYRESDTQTDPWTPEYIVRPGSAPEVCTIQKELYHLILGLLLY